MFKWLGFIMGLILALTLTFAKPAFAAPLHGCPDNNICFYQNNNFMAERWQSSYSNVFHSSAGGVNNCLNLAPANWSNGTNVEDNTSGSVFNAVDEIPWNQYWIVLYNWVNCNADGQYSLFDTVGGSAGYLSQWHYFTNNSANISLYHTITSIGLIPRTSITLTPLQKKQAYSLVG